MRISKGIKASATYTLSNFITKGIGIITIPIYTRIMTTDQIGVVATYNAWMAILAVIASMGLTTGSFSIAMHEHKDFRNQYESAALTLTTIVSVLLMIIYAIFFQRINVILGLPWQLIVLMLTGFMLHPAIDFWMARQRFEYKYKLCAAISITCAAVSSVLSLIVVYLFSNNHSDKVAIGRLYATYFVYYGVALVLYICIMIQGKTFFHVNYWKYGIKLSIPLMFHALAKHVLDVSDKIMIKRMCGDSSVGIYGTLYSISSLSLLIWNAINASLVPFMFSCMENKSDDRKKMNQIIIPMLAIYGFVSVALVLIAPEIVTIIAPAEYYEAIYIMPPVAAGIYFISLYCVMGNVLLYHKKTNRIMSATFIAAILNIVLNNYFIRIYGYIAAAYTTLFCNIVLAVMQGYMAKMSERKLPFNIEVIGLLSFMVVICVLPCSLLYKYVGIRYGIIAVLLIVMYSLRRKIIELYRQMMAG